MSYLDTVTFQAPDNTYRDESEASQRLDYIFYILPTTPSNNINIFDNNKKYEWRVKESNIIKIYTNQNHSISDHFGVDAIFEYSEIRSSSYGSNIDEITSVDERSSIISMDKYCNNKNTLIELRSLMREAIEENDRQRYHNYSYGILVYFIILLIISKFGNTLPNWLLVILFLAPIYCVYEVVYTKMVICDSMRQYKEIVNEINLKCKIDDDDSKHEILI